MHVSRRKICAYGLAGTGAMFEAADWKAINLPVWLIDAAVRLSPFAAEPSGAIVISCTTPAVAASGERIGNTAVFDVSPLAVSFTVSFADPGCSTSEAVTCA
jgi:hypothetical protein